MMNLTIAGTVGKDAEIKHTQGGDPLASFSVAVNGRKRDDPPTWFECTFFGKRGQAVAQYITKGGKVTVNGEFSKREYNGKTYLQLNVRGIALQGGSGAGNDARPASEPAASHDDTDEIPF